MSLPSLGHGFSHRLHSASAEISIDGGLLEQKISAQKQGVEQESIHSPNVVFQKRFAAHCAGRGAKYTRSHPPLRIAYAKVFEDKSTALKQEAAIKKLTHAQKTLLIAQTKLDLFESDHPGAQN